LYVLLLHAVRHPVDAEIFMVETLFDHYANSELFNLPPGDELNHVWFGKLFQIQFLVVFCHTIQIQFQPDCGYSKPIGALLSTNAALFTYMFSSFYIQSYKKQQKKAAALDENATERLVKPVKAE